MTKRSAGILLYKFTDSVVEFFLVHPGGPFFVNKDLGSWSIPKGEFDDTETPFEAAIREFKEETGVTLESSSIELSPIVQKSGKIVFAWAIEGDINPSNVCCNMFSMEWPPKSGKMQEFPENDKGEWFNYNKAKEKINQAQIDLIEQVVVILKLPADRLTVGNANFLKNTKQGKQDSQLSLF